MKHLFLSVAAAIAGAFALQAADKDIPAYFDKSLPCEVRAHDLASRLTLDEKVSLLLYDSPAVERLGIQPYNWWNEALHGVGRNGDATMYPMPIGMAASFDVELLHKVFSQVSDEIRIKNRIARSGGEGSGWYEGLSFWTPNINIFRDPRWGRGMETYGEDPYLMSVMGGAVVDGLQGDDPEHLKALACAKHFAVHSGPEYSRHRFDANVSQRDLYETYLPAFKYLVTEKNVQQVMFAYNRFRGVPCGANTELLLDILRNEWGYKALVVSDCWAVDDFFRPGRHGYVATAEEAAAASIKAGCEIECGAAFKSLGNAVRQGLISEDAVTEALVHNLTARFALGEIDNESVYDTSIPSSLLCCDGHKATSLQMARESIVLLQNRGGILPLAPGAKVALLGTNADDIELMWGNYNGIPAHTVTLLEAMKKKSPDIKFIRCGELVQDEITPERLERILAELDGIETVVYAGGLSPRLEGEEMPVEIPGFKGGDRTSIELPACQRNFLRSLSDNGKKVVFVNFSGSAVALQPETVSCDAILQVWYPGQEGGTAIAEALYGDFNPSGKLPVTFYANDAQLPDYENYDMHGHTYRFIAGKPLFAFGYGLSYTDFKMVKAKVRFGRLVVKVKNTGLRDGTETMQLYVRRPDDTAGPVKTLRGFRRVDVPAGKTRKVVIRLNDSIFDWWSDETQRVQPLKGVYELHLGTSSDDEGMKVLRYKYRG
ncbi:MAG: glycoside hydrolase family 3 C-terminal domain-containing protein [Candidatus Cryptobacteroides sp.]